MGAWMGRHKEDGRWVCMEEKGEECVCWEMFSYLDESVSCGHLTVSLSIL